MVLAYFIMGLNASIQPPSSWTVSTGIWNNNAYWNNSAIYKNTP